jgi:hypothetical protein
MDSFDRLKALGGIPASHAGRRRFEATADPLIVGTVHCGVIFVMAFWSAPSRKAFEVLERVLSELDASGRLELVVIDADRSEGLQQLPEFAGKLHGAGETAWVKDGKILRTSGLGFHPECFETFTKELIRNCSPELPISN